MKIVLYIFFGLFLSVILLVGGGWIYAKKAYSPPKAINLLMPTASFGAEDVQSIYDLSCQFEKETRISIGLIKDGQISYYGFIRKGDSLIMESNNAAVFEIGSITKVMTAYVMTALTEEGVVDMEASILQYLPIDNTVLDAVKVKHLANHTSGLPRLPNNLNAFKNNPYAEYGPLELYEYLNGIETELAVGVESDYSNLGFGLLGHILELASNRSLDQLFKDYIFLSGQMHNSSTLLDSVSNIVTPGIGMFNFKGVHWDFNVLGGCGAVKSSADQMINFGQLLMQEDGVASKLRMPTFAVGKSKIGQALMINESEDGPTIFWHNGGTGGFRSCMALEIESKTGVVVLSNLNLTERKSGNIDQMCFTLLKSNLK